MPVFDLPLEELRRYQAPPSEPDDFDDFWRRTLAEAAEYPLDACYAREKDDVYRHVAVHDGTFHGWGGHPIKGWLLEPAGNDEPLPCIVTYVGYGGGRGIPVDHLAPAVAGFAHFVMDTRGQGSGWSPGDTPDPAGGGPHQAGFVTKGIESPEHYYYRRVFTDAARAVAAAAAHEHVDANRIAVSGGSQGGGIAIAAAALAAERVRVLMADVPFLCHFRRGVELAQDIGYAEIRRYLACHRGRTERVFRTLSYFDGVNFAPRIRARTLFSVGLMDMICPPSTVFAAYNRIRAEKQIRAYNFNEHEGGGPFQTLERLRFALEGLGDQGLSPEP